MRADRVDAVYMATDDAFEPLRDSEEFRRALETGLGEDLLRAMEASWKTDPETEE